MAFTIADDVLGCCRADCYYRFWRLRRLRRKGAYHAVAHRLVALSPTAVISHERVGMPHDRGSAFVSFLLPRRHWKLFVPWTSAIKYCDGMSSILPRKNLIGSVGAEGLTLSLRSFHTGR